MRTALFAFLAVSLVVVLIAGCGGGGVPTINIGNNTTVDLPVGTSAVSPTVAKFGPIATYLPPSGTSITYRIASILDMGNSSTRLLFKSYNNTTGTAVLEIWGYEDSVLSSHTGFTLWFKVINGRSYVSKRTKVFYDEVRAPETTTFTPGVLMGLFSATPAQLACNFTSAGHSTGTNSFVAKYGGTANVVAAGQTFSTVISEVRSFMPGDPAGIQLYWAAGKGPIMFSVSPAIVIKGVMLRLPWWRKLGSITATNITAAQ